MFIIPVNQYLFFKYLCVKTHVLSNYTCMPIFSIHIRNIKKGKIQIKRSDMRFFANGGGLITD